MASSKSQLVLKGLSVELAEWLQHLPDAPELSDPGAEERLFPDPDPDGTAQLEGDWKALIQPELDSLFRSAREVIRKDCESISQDGDGLVLSIPSNHFDAWLSGLNQVRLALGARYQIEDSDLSREPDTDRLDERTTAIFQIHFFGTLQEIILSAINSEEFPEG